MTKRPPLNQNELDALRLSVEGSIRKAFSHVRRASGVSWSEADVIDDYGTAEQRAQARLLDKDAAWEQLVDDPSWPAHANASNFSFLDSAGRRYYLPALMIRAMKNSNTVDLEYYLRLPPDYLDKAQTHAVARYIYFMWQRALVNERGSSFTFESDPWNELLTGAWRDYLNEPKR